MKTRYIAVGDHWVPFEQAPEMPSTHFIIGEIPAYESPIDGHLVDSRRKRRDDLKRNDCRPWEGMEAEKKEAERVMSGMTQRDDAKLDDAVARAYYQMSPEKRRILRGAT